MFTLASLKSPVGFPDLVHAGLWNASFHLGNFVGPTVSGFMVEAWGFRSTTVVFLCVFVVMGFVDLCELCFHLGKRARGRRRRDGYEKIKE